MFFFTRLYKLWDESAYLQPLLVCECGTTKLIDEINNEGKLIQFLIGLSDTYDQVKNQILSMELLPRVNRALFNGANS